MVEDASKEIAGHCYQNEAFAFARHFVTTSFRSKILDLLLLNCVLVGVWTSLQSLMKHSRALKPMVQALFKKSTVSSSATIPLAILNRCSFSMVEAMRFMASLMDGIIKWWQLWQVWLELFWDIFRACHSQLLKKFRQNTCADRVTLCPMLPSRYWIS